MNDSLTLMSRPSEVVSDPSQQSIQQKWLAETEAASTEHSLRVLVVLSHMPLETGSGVYVQEIIRELQSLGHKPHLLAAHYRPLTHADVPSLSDDQLSTVIFDNGENSASRDVAFPIPGMSPDMPYLHVDFQSLSRDQLDDYCRTWIGKIRDVVEKIQPHIIHVNHLWLLPAIARVAASWLPIVATSHGTDYKLLFDAPAFAPLVLPGVQSLDAIMAISRDMAAAVITKFDVRPDCMFVIGNGYNEHLFKITSRASSMSRLQDLLAPFPDLHPWRKLVLSVGRFADFKGIPYLIQAAKLYSDVHGALTLIVGEGTRQTRAQLENLVGDAGLTNKVLLPGKIAHQDVCLLMNAADVFVLPSVDEPFGLVLLEAMACGVRSVAAERGGPPFFVPMHLREKGLISLIKPLHLFDTMHPDTGDEQRYIQSLAAAIALHLSAREPEQDRQLIAQAVSDQTWAVKVKQIIQVYRSTIQHRRQNMMKDV